MERKNEWEDFQGRRPIICRLGRCAAATVYYIIFCPPFSFVPKLSSLSTLNTDFTLWHTQLNWYFLWPKRVPFKAKIDIFSLLCYLLLKSWRYNVMKLLFYTSLQIHTAEWQQINLISLTWDTCKNFTPGLQFFHVSHIRKITLIRCHLAVCVCSVVWLIKTWNNCTQK